MNEEESEYLANIIKHYEAKIESLERLIVGAGMSKNPRQHLSDGARGLGIPPFSVKKTK